MPIVFGSGNTQSINYNRGGYDLLIGGIDNDTSSGYYGPMTIRGYNGSGVEIGKFFEINPNNLTSNSYVRLMNTNNSGNSYIEVGVNTLTITSSSVNISGPVTFQSAVNLPVLLATNSISKLSLGSNNLVTLTASNNSGTFSIGYLPDDSVMNLDVYGDIVSTGGNIKAGSAGLNGTLYLFGPASGITTTDGLQLQMDSGNNVQLYNKENGNMVFHTNNIERARFLADGAMRFNNSSGVSNTYTYQRAVHATFSDNTAATLFTLTGLNVSGSHLSCKVDVCIGATSGGTTMSSRYHNFSFSRIYNGSTSSVSTVTTVSGNTASNFPSQLDITTVTAGVVNVSASQANFIMQIDVTGTAQTGSVIRVAGMVTLITRNLSAPIIT